MKIRDEMDIVGNEEVLRDLHYKVSIGRNGKPRKRVLFVLGGGKAGVVTAERLDVFAQRGISADYFDLIVAISAGAYNTLAYGSKQTHELSDLYRYFCGLPTWVWNPVGVLLKEIEARLNLDAFRKCEPEVLFATSGYFRKLRLPSAKHAKDIFALLRAVASIPPFSFGWSEDGRLAFDGAFAHPCPVRRSLLQVMRTWESDAEIDVVILPNRPRPEFLPWYDPAVYAAGANTILFLLAPLLCFGANAIDGRINAIVKMAQNHRKHSRFRVCAWFPHRSNYIFPVEMDAVRVLAVGASERVATKRYFEKNRPITWV